LNIPFRGPREAPVFRKHARRALGCQRVGKTLAFYGVKAGYRGIETVILGVAGNDSGSAAGNLGSKNLPFPKVIDSEAPPPRTERHVPNSIATMRRRLIIALVSTLSRCPCCATPVAKGSRRKKFMTQ
jgi:hypothetical protein